jgi:hypothetical protein
LKVKKKQFTNYDEKKLIKELEKQKTEYAPKFGQILLTNSSNKQGVPKLPAVIINLFKHIESIIKG